MVNGTQSSRGKVRTVVRKADRCVRCCSGYLHVAQIRQSFYQSFLVCNEFNNMESRGPWLGTSRRDRIRSSSGRPRFFPKTKTESSKGYLLGSHPDYRRPRLVNTSRSNVLERRGDGDRLDLDWVPCPWAHTSPLCRPGHRCYLSGRLFAPTSLHLGTCWCIATIFVSGLGWLRRRAFRDNLHFEPYPTLPPCGVVLATGLYFWRRFGHQLCAGRIRSCNDRVCFRAFRLATEGKNRHYPRFYLCDGRMRQMGGQEPQPSRGTGFAEERHTKAPYSMCLPRALPRSDCLFVPQNRHGSKTILRRTPYVHSRNMDRKALQPPR